MVEIFFPHTMNFGTALQWARSRGFPPNRFVKSLTRPMLGFVFVFDLTDAP